MINKIIHHLFSFIYIMVIMDTQCSETKDTRKGYTFIQDISGQHTYTLMLVGEIENPNIKHPQTPTSTNPLWLNADL